MKKRLLSLLIVLSLVLSLLPVATFAAGNVIASGNCGFDNEWDTESASNATWTLTSDGVLTISGFGRTDEYLHDDGEMGMPRIFTPWYEYRESIIQAVVGEGITKLGRETFFGCSNLEKVIIPETVNLVDWRAFCGCAKLKSAGPIGSGCSIEFGWIEEIPDYAFSNLEFNSFCAIIPASVTEIGEWVDANSYDASVYFLGNAPKVIPKEGIDTEDGYRSESFSHESTILYYIEGKTGWTDSEYYDVSTGTWNGYQLKTWDGVMDGIEVNPDTGEEDVFSGLADIVSLTPANHAENVESGSLKIQFDRDVSNENRSDRPDLDFNKEPLAIYRAEDDELVYQVEESSYTSGTSVDMLVRSYSMDTVSCDTIKFDPETTYYVTMGEGFIKMADGTVSPEIKKGDWEFTTASVNVEAFETIETIRIRTGEGSQEYDLPNVVWKDNWFSESATTYNHELAKTSLALSSAAYGGPGHISYALEQFGFDYTSVNYLEDDEDYGGNYDQVSYAFASKQIDCEDREYTLVAVVVRGTPGNGEWYSNFNISVDDTHRGFSNAEYDVEKNLKTYLKARGVSKDNVKFLVTGHSRGAAVANLLAADLIGDGYSNVFGYTFATPTVSKKAKQTGYESIFNIINQEDFVTQVPLGTGKWGYRQYGVNLTLPSRSFYPSDSYEDLYRKMNLEYVFIRGEHFTPYKNGAQIVSDLTLMMYTEVPTVYDFYTKRFVSVTHPTMDSYFQALAGVIASGKLNNIGEIFAASASEFVAITLFFVDNHVLQPRIFSAHSQAGYLAWMRSCTSDELFGANNKAAYPTYKQVKVACPVDVYVYDKAGTLVASVVNEEVVADTLAVSVQDGVKTIDLPADQEYRVEIKAREAGTVDYTVEEKSVDSAIDTTRTVFFDDITITKGDKLVSEITEEPSSQTYSLTKNNQTVITATSDSDAPSDLPFTDVVEKDWFYNDVKYVYENGLMNGVGEGLFGPGGTTTRGMIVTILYRLEGEPSTALSAFQDVASNQWYAKAVGWAAANGIVTGYSESQFGPNDKITREQMAAILYRYAAYKGYDVSQRADLSKYEDKGAISSYAVDSMAWANGEGLINGIDADTLNPKGSAIRAQVAAILHRFCENIA